MKQHPPRQIFEKLVNKNAIKHKIGAPPRGGGPWQFFLKPLSPPTVVTNLKLGAEKIFPLKIVDVFIEMAKTHKKVILYLFFGFFGS